MPTKSELEERLVELETELEEMYSKLGTLIGIEPNGEELEDDEE